jgi:hypothetical protein
MRYQPRISSSSLLASGRNVSRRVDALREYYARTAG